MQTPVSKFEYLKSPDGEDLPQKLQYLFKRAAVATLGLGTMDVFLYSHPKGYVNTLARYLTLGVPIMGAAATFAITTNLVGSLRKKDDALNWLAGGAGVGAIYGMWRGKTVQVFFAAFYIGCFCAMFKHAKQAGYVFHPEEVDPQYGGVRSVRSYWSFIKDRPGNWTRGEQ